MNTLELAVDLSPWKVFPVNGKIPATKNGYLDATNDPEEVRRMFARHKGGIGIAMRSSGLVAIDIDMKNGLDGVSSFKGLLAGHPPMIYGPIQRTKNNGYHIIGKDPDDVTIPNRVNVFPGIDIRTDGYIVTGPGYTWLEGHNYKMPVPDLPWWLVDMLAERPKPKEYTPQLHGPQPTGDLALYLMRFYLREAQPGNRNHAAYRFGLQLFYADISLAEAEGWGARFARECPQGNHPFTESEAWNAIKSAYRSKNKKPAWVDHGRK